MSHWGMPGPGGSMGRCAVCGKDFLVGVLMDLSGYPSGIQQFSVGCIEETLYAHAPKCIDALRDSLADGEIVIEKLPAGPLKQALQEPEIDP